MKTMLWKSMVAASWLALFAGGCDVYVRPPANAEVVVGEAPPTAPPYLDVQTVSPGPDFVWIGGAWMWGGNSWVWEKGHWDRRPHPGAVWMANHYEFHNGRHVFVRGHWR